MAQPTPYDRQYSFSSWQSQHPSDPLPGDEVDAELNAVKATTDEIIVNLGKIQRDDGNLANETVGLEQLKPEVSVGVAPAVAWTADTYFALNATVFNELILYRCIEAHTSTSVFDASKFTELADLSSLNLADGSITTTKLADQAVTTAKLADGNVTPSKMGGFPASTLVGRYSASAGGPQFVTLGSGLTFVGTALTATPPTLADGSITTAKIVDANVTGAKLASGAAVANIGYTPLNKAGDTITGGLVRQSAGAHLYHGDSALASGKITVSTSAPSGGSDGDIWIQVSS
jgi:hypothetical protein